MSRNKSAFMNTRMNQLMNRRGLLLLDMYFANAHISCDIYAESAQVLPKQWEDDAVPDHVEVVSFARKPTTSFTSQLIRRIHTNQRCCLMSTMSHQAFGGKGIS